MYFIFHNSLCFQISLRMNDIRMAFELDVPIGNISRITQYQLTAMLIG